MWGQALGTILQKGTQSPRQPRAPRGAPLQKVQGHGTGIGQTSGQIPAPRHTSCITWVEARSQPPMCT